MLIFEYYVKFADFPKFLSTYITVATTFFALNLCIQFPIHLLSSFLSQLNPAHPACCAKCCNLRWKVNALCSDMQCLPAVDIVHFSSALYNIFPMILPDKLVNVKWRAGHILCCQQSDQETAMQSNSSLTGLELPTN